MTGKDARRQYHFNVWDDSLISFLDSHPKFAEWAREIFDDLRTGKLSYDTSEEDYSTKLKQIKLEAMIANEKRKAELHPLIAKNKQLDNALKEKQLTYYDTFEKKPTPQANNAMKVGVYNQNTQSKVVQREPVKNYYINKVATNEYIGCCKICKNFTTDICQTSNEAEGDVEAHLEIVHHKGLYTENFET